MRRVNLLENVRRARVRYVNEKIRRRRLFERSAETRDKMVWQIAHESDRVAQQDGPPTGQKPASRARVERRKKHIPSKDSRFRHGVEKRTLPRVRIADKTHAAALLASRDLTLFAAMNRGEVAFELDDSLLSDTPVDFQLLFARTAKPHAAYRLAFQVRPHTLQTRQRIFKLGKLDRQSRLARLGAGRKYVENELRPIDYFRLQTLLQIARLPRRQIEIE